MCEPYLPVMFLSFHFIIFQLREGKFTTFLASLSYFLSWISSSLYQIHLLYYNVLLFFFLVWDGTSMNVLYCLFLVHAKVNKYLGHLKASSSFFLCEAHFSPCGANSPIDFEICSWTNSVWREMCDKLPRCEISLKDPLYWTKPLFMPMKRSGLVYMSVEADILIYNTYHYWHGQS